jgi:hypothetical protein
MERAKLSWQPVSHATTCTSTHRQSYPNHHTMGFVKPPKPIRYQQQTVTDGSNEKLASTYQMSYMGRKHVPREPIRPTTAHEWKGNGRSLMRSTSQDAFVRPIFRVKQMDNFPPPIGFVPTPHVGEALDSTSRRAYKEHRVPRTPLCVPAQHQLFHTPQHGMLRSTSQDSFTRSSAGGRAATPVNMRGNGLPYGSADVRPVFDTTYSTTYRPHTVQAFVMANKPPDNLGQTRLSNSFERLYGTF